MMNSNKNIVEYEKCLKYMSVIQTLEFVSEYLLSIRGPPSEMILEQLFGLLTVFECVKVKLRYERWRRSKNMQICISESNPYERQELEEEGRAEQFQEEWSCHKSRSSVSEIKEQLQRMKKPERFKFNLSYQDTIGQKEMGVITTLPIPEQFKRVNNNRNKKVRIFIGELMHLVRPMIYCVLLYVYGQHSYIPYLCSLCLDVLRVLLQKDIDFYRKSERVEMDQRIRSVVTKYILRNPFYTQIFKAKVLLPLLGLLFKQNSFIARAIIYLIELRSSISLLI